MIDLLSRKLAAQASTNAVSALSTATSNALFTASGTAAQTRSVQDRLLDTVNLYDYLSPAQVNDVRACNATIDIAPQLQALISYVYGQGGGIIRFDAGCALLATPVRLYSGVTIAGGAGGVDGFATSKGAASFKQAATASGNVVNHVAVVSGGSGYTNATVTFSNGATAQAYVQGSAVVCVSITDCGTPTSGAITATVAGDGAGATVAVLPSVPMFYQQGSQNAVINMHNVTLIGNNNPTSAGIVLSNATPFFHNFRAYMFGLSAWKRIGGSGGQIMGAQIFGVARNGMTPGSSSYYAGTLDESGNDLQIANVEAGAAYSGDSTNLWNAAIRLSGNSSATQLSNIVAEGADVGILCSGAHVMMSNVRCDINYGHGLWLHRINPALSPPWYAKLWGVWCHRNGRYQTGRYDNLRIESGDAIIGTCISGYYSSNSALDNWTHRYGLYDGATGTVTQSFMDVGAATAKFGQAANNAPGPIQLKTPLTTMAAASSMAINGLREVRVTNSGGAVTISTLTGGFHGDELILQTNANNVSLGHGGTASTAMYLAGGQSRLLAAYETVCFRNIAGTWYEICPWTKQAAIASPTADVTALKTAVDAIRTTLQALGMTS